MPVDDKALKKELKDLLHGQFDEKTAMGVLKVRKLDAVKKMRRYLYNFPADFRAEASSKRMSARGYAELIYPDTWRETFAGKLRDYQTVGAAFLELSPRSMLGDGVGLGKTVEVCAMLNYRREQGDRGMILVAAEKTAVPQLRAEIEKFTGLRALVIAPEKDKMARQLAKLGLVGEFDSPIDGVPNIRLRDRRDWADVLVVNHSSLRSDYFLTWFSRTFVNGVSPLTTFILDESAVVKSPNAIITQCTAALCMKFPRVHFLNATVFELKLLDMATQFMVLYPGFLPGRKWVDDNFCNYKRVKFYIKGGHGASRFKYEITSYRNQDKFKRLVSLAYLTRRKEDVNIETGEREYKVYLIEQTVAQRKAITQGFRYFEILNCPSLCPDANIPTDPKHVPKLERLLTLLTEDYFGRQVIVYAWHIGAQKAIADNLRERGIACDILNGEADDRPELIESFNSGKINVLVTNVKRSLNLWAGDVCVFYSVETNPASLEQIAGRIDRNIDTKAKEFVLLAYEGQEEDFFYDTVAFRAREGNNFADVESKVADEFGKIIYEMRQ